VPIDAGDVGQRVVIRSFVPDQLGPTGGPAMTDVVGLLQAYDGVAAVVRRRDGTSTRVPVTQIVAAKTVPPAPPGPRIDAEDLQRVCSEGWPAPVREPLGEWELRAAAGFTGRANSALVAGSPGMALSEALEEVAAFYHRHHLPPRAQVVEDSVWDHAIADEGWRQMSGSRGGALVMVAPLRMAPTNAAAVQVSVSTQVDDAWLSLYNRTGGHDTGAARALLEGPRDVGFARIGEPPVAIGRMVVTGAWAGLAAIEVAAAHRRRGLATAVADRLVQWALERGARWCYLQVTPDNEAALALWRRYGFRPHHAYHYLEPS
jgi:ribosomal protein S18 acetylase RimI-like enzyme